MYLKRTEEGADPPACCRAVFVRGAAISLAFRLAIQGKASLPSAIETDYLLEIAAAKLALHLGRAPAADGSAGNCWNRLTSSKKER
jgi:hypothetical protein